jgi:hypothetical protein
MRRWTTVALVVLAVLDVVVLVLGYRALDGSLPPLQNEAPPLVFSTPSPGETPTSGEPEEDTVTGPLLLGANRAGDVLRATRGACQASFDNPARVWVANIDTGLLEEVEVLGLREALGLMVYADGTFRISGLDEGCEAVTFESDDGGATWPAADNAEIWRLSSDTTANSVIGPAGDADVPVDCPARQLLNLPGRKALASCSATSFFVLPPPDEEANLLSVAGYEQLSVAPGDGVGRYFVFGATERCDAHLGEFDASTASVSPIACLHDDEIGPRAPLAIARAGDRLVVQGGNDLMVSSDGGSEFTPVGGETAG